MDDQDPPKRFTPVTDPMPASAPEPLSLDEHRLKIPERAPKMIRTPEEEAAERNVKTSKFRT